MNSLLVWYSLSTLPCCPFKTLLEPDRWPSSYFYFVWMWALLYVSSPAYEFWCVLRVEAEWFLNVTLSSSVVSLLLAISFGSRDEPRPLLNSLWRFSCLPEGYCWFLMVLGETRVSPGRGGLPSNLLASRLFILDASAASFLCYVGGVPIEENAAVGTSLFTTLFWCTF